MRDLLNIIHGFIKEYTTFLLIKSDPEKRSASKKYGIRSIILSILMIPTSFSVLLLKSGMFGENILLTIFIAIFLIVFALMAPILLFSHSLMSSIFQMRLNKKPLGWISLIIAILCLATAIIIALALITQ